MASGDVVVVSQFGAQAGGTPGNYIRRYTARLDATEELSPYTIVQSPDAYIEAYDERIMTAEDSISNLESEDILFKNDAELTDQSARLFGNQGIVYSRDQFTRAVSKTEKALEEGHTLITPVVSFTHEYLRERGVIPEDMPPVINNEDEGAYHGQVDQLKLRRALTSGMNELTSKSYFVDPEWTAAIQVDTANVHVHFTLIETCDHNDVPKERYVQSPKKETRVRQLSNGDLKEEIIPVVDSNGEPVYENLGERGKLQPRAIRGFREGLERSLTRMKSSKHLANDVSAHRQLVKQHSSHLSLEHTALSSQLVQIYEALPKGNVSPESSNFEQDKALRSEQPNWRASSNRVSMKEANKLANEYVDRLFENHGDAIGYNHYVIARDEYLESARPDLPNTDKSNERIQLRKVLDNQLREETINALYRSLKPIRVTSDVESYNESIMSEMDDRERIPIEGQLTPRGLQLALLSDEQLKDLISDSLHEDDPGPFASSLSLEKRLRDYPDRYNKSKSKKQYYKSLKEEYENLESSNAVTDESHAMHELYSNEMSYYEGIEDKYSYLMDKRSKSYLEYSGSRYPLPDGDIIDNEWVERVHPRIVNQVDKIPTIPDTEATRLDISVEDRLPEVIVDKIQSDSIIPLSERVKHDNKIRQTTRIYDDLNYQYERISMYSGVSQERFNEVRSYDLIETIYDFDPNASRDISPDVISGYKSLQERRQDIFNKAIEYMDNTNQNTDMYPEYSYYRDEMSGVEQSLDFIEVAEKSNSLPKPFRRHHDTDDVVRKLEENRVMPSNDAKDFNVEFLSQASTVVDSKREDIKDLTKSIDVDTEYDISDELLRINQYYIDLLRKRDEEKAAEDISNTQHYQVRNVPSPVSKVKDGDLDKEYVRELFKDQTRDIIPRYISSYYETSYNDPSMDI